eukprot:5740934-Prymnesium_polylepis.2
MFCGSGNVVLTPLRPPVGCSESCSAGRLDSSWSGGTAGPDSSGAYLWLKSNRGRCSRRWQQNRNASSIKERNKCPRARVWGTE